MTNYGVLRLDGQEIKLVNCRLETLSTYPPDGVPPGPEQPHENGLVVSWREEPPANLAGFTRHPDLLMVLDVPSENGSVPVARPLDGQAARYLPVDKFPVSDRAVGLAPGTLYRTAGRDMRPAALFCYGAGLGPLSGLSPDIDQNPYNWVSREGAGPTLLDGPHPGHDRFWPRPGHLTGYFDCSLETLTALFVPEGFPFRAGQDGQQPDAEALRSKSRHFFRMRRAGGNECYAVPGSSIKGMLRSAVEAVTNSRFGAVNQAEFARPLPFRCTAMDSGIIRSMPTPAQVGQIEVVRVFFLDNYYNRNPAWQPHLPAIKAHHARSLAGLPAGFPARIRLLQNGHCIPAGPGDPTSRCFTTQDAALDYSLMPFEGNLLGAPATGHRFDWMLVVRRRNNPPLLAWDDDLLQSYRSLLTSPHYGSHWIDCHRAYPGLTQEHFADGLELAVGKLVWFTIQGRVASHGAPNPLLPSLAGGLSNLRLRTIGRNVRHLWPAEVGREELFSRWYPLGVGSANLDSGQLSVAEQIFGYSARHRPENVSHPFQSLIQLETAWSERPALPYQEEQSATNLRVQLQELAALTSPATPGKSRPLYLEPRADGHSKDYRSAEQCVGRGRKFYWHQNNPGDSLGIWQAHRRSPNHPASQCPPPIYALAPGERFTFRLWFRNLAPVHLGALLAVIEGSHPSHALKLGKGRPRGLGSVRLAVDSIRLLAPDAWYSSQWLPEDDSDGPPAADSASGAWIPADNQHKASWRQAFDDVFPSNCRSRREFDSIHRFPGGERLRLYPISFSQYSWNYMAGDPWSDCNTRPKSLSPALEISETEATG